MAAVEPFVDIRPYRDDEVAAVIARLCSSPALAQGIMKVQFPRVPSYLEAPLTRYIQRKVNNTLGTVSTIAQFQALTGEFLEQTIATTFSDFSHSGVNHLQHDKPYLFISNHRDITLDSALLNYVLLGAGMESAQIAIGDNLLRQSLVADLLRLNKSFIVNRSAQGLKQKYRALTELSQYMFETHGQGCSLWIAQREGRAKDGRDVTDPAILKMLHVWAKKQGLSFAETLQHYNIVPVSVSYEYDPCDALKVQESLALEQPDYEKSAVQDMASIMRGIAMPKGRVHLHVGEVLDVTSSAAYNSPETAAAAIDEQIVAQYRLFPSNLLALDQLLTSNPGDFSERVLESAQGLREQLCRLMPSQELSAYLKHFRDRIVDMSEPVQEGVLEQYANPVLNKIRLGCY